MTKCFTDVYNKGDGETNKLYEIIEGPSLLMALMGFQGKIRNLYLTFFQRLSLIIKLQ